MQSRSVCVGNGHGFAAWSKNVFQLMYSPSKDTARLISSNYMHVKSQNRTKCFISMIIKQTYCGIINLKLTAAVAAVVVAIFLYTFGERSKKPTSCGVADLL